MKTLSSKYDYNVIPIDLSGAALDDREYELHADALFHMTGSTELKIRLNSRTADQLILKPGGWIGLPCGKFYVSAPKVEDVVSVVAFRPGGMLVQSQEFRLGGYVQVVPGRNLELAESQFYQSSRGNSFISCWGLLAVVAEYPCAILLNPEGSGKNMYIESCSFSPAAATGDVEFVFLTGSGIKNDPAPNATLGINKLRPSGPPSISQLFKDTGAVKYEYIVDPRIVDVCRISALSIEKFSYSQGFVLAPGSCVAVSAGQQNISANVTIEWTELEEN